MNGIAITRAEHATRLINLAVDQAAHRLRLIDLNVSVTDQAERLRLKKWALAEAEKNLRDAEDFRGERCRVCHGVGYEQIEVPKMTDRPPYPTINGAPCGPCLGTGKHR